MILTMSHWSSGLPVCFPPQGTQVQILWGGLKWYRDSPVSVVSLQGEIIIFGEGNGGKHTVVSWPTDGPLYTTEVKLTSTEQKKRNTLSRSQISSSLQYFTSIVLHIQCANPKNLFNYLHSLKYILAFTQYIILAWRVLVCLQFLWPVMQQAIRGRPLHPARHRLTFLRRVSAATWRQQYF